MANGTQAVQLRCAVQSYAWGKIGNDSAVAQLAQCNPSFKLDSKKPYSELWMGTHPNGPSEVIGAEGKEKFLSGWIETNGTAMGDKVKEVFNGCLPFLFKVLSVNKSLSIQAHPNKKHAEQLHATRPDVYKDPNHKPEMAIALTQFEGMCGFRPVAEIQSFLSNVPEFAVVIGQEASSAVMSCSGADQQAAQALKSAFTALMTSGGETVTGQLNKLLERITVKKASGQEISDCQGELFLRLHSQFPGDVGCFCIYFLNHVTLQPGQAMFLGPNLPHAYLYGDCMECMACSDNVVRAGLTPKFKDVGTLCEMLDYKPGTAEENIFPSHQDTHDPFVNIYDPPVQDFSVAKIEIPESCTESYQMKPVSGPSIVITISGTANAVAGSNAIQMERGTVIFISANCSVDLKNRNGNLLLFRAFCAL